MHREHSTATQDPCDSDSIHRTKRVRRSANTGNSNLLAIKPLGNLLLNPHLAATRERGLGSLRALPDPVLLSCIMSILSWKDLIRLSAVSRVCYAWSSMDGLWKSLYIEETKGRLLNWTGSWRRSFAAYMMASNLGDVIPSIPPSTVTTPSLHSDVLFQPHLAASFDPNTIFASSKFVETVARADGRSLTPADLPLTPVILTNLMNWPSFSHRLWTIESLSARFAHIQFRAEATLTTLPTYGMYHDDCLDDSPLYLFDSDFVEKTSNSESLQRQEDGSAQDGIAEKGLGADYTVPHCFSEDLFEVMKEKRPDFRWIIIGPERSGSTWHQDPNGTSAWNAVMVGSKAWVMFPPEITPPGVFVSDDRADVSAPHTLAEWFISYYQVSKATYGPNARDPAMRNKMLEGICRAGEIFFVPQGWWHIVVNLSPSVAVTQNFVGRRELPAVLRFMRDRPEQVSGFKFDRGVPATTGLDDCDEILEGVYEAFCDALEASRPEIAVEILQEVKRDLDSADSPARHDEGAEGAAGLWETMKDADALGFSFGFFRDDSEELLEEGDDCSNDIL